MAWLVLFLLLLANSFHLFQRAKEGDFPSCLGFVTVLSLGKQEFAEHDPILKTITLTIGQTLPVISLPTPPQS